MVNMQTDKALEVMLAITPDVARIMNDPDADGVIARVKAKDPTLEAGDAVQALVPLFARKYRAELYRIVAAFQGVPEEQIGSQDIATTVMHLASGLRVYAGFFGCCLHMALNM